MAIRVYNTTHNQKEDFIPLVEGRVGMYCCGPTTYNYIHLGNARPLVVFDTIRRYLLWRGFEVTYVQNFTDIDDKIIKRGVQENLSAAQIAAKYIAAYFEDAQALRVLPADVHPKVTEHIEDIVVMIQEIIDNGHAYVVDGDVYFDVTSFPQYGKLSGRALEDMQAGARVEVGDVKRNPWDFALWKAAKPNEPAWESPWGMGRPGWHIECSAMSCKYLGKEFDIHGGGADLIFPHHENEIAQSQAANSGGFARYWLHNGFITVNDEKMSKSLGNFFLLRDILEKFSGDIVRFYLLSTHYRSPIDFSDDKLLMAQKSLERIRNSYYLLQESEKRAVEAPAALTETIAIAKAAFVEAMDDDFNTALAVAAVFDFCHELNAYLQDNVQPSTTDIKDAKQLFADFDSVLGMILPQEQSNSGLAEDLLQLILEIRTMARGKKDWATSDFIRDGLKNVGIVLEDTPQGVRWKKA